MYRDFPGSPALPVQGAQVQSLVRELRSPFKLLHATATPLPWVTIVKKKRKITNATDSIKNKIVSIYF